MNRYFFKHQIISISNFKVTLLRKGNLFFIRTSLYIFALHKILIY